MLFKNAFVQFRNTNSIQICVTWKKLFTLCRTKGVHSENTHFNFFPFTVQFVRYFMIEKRTPLKRERHFQFFFWSTALSQYCTVENARWSHFWFFPLYENRWKCTYLILRRFWRFIERCSSVRTKQYVIRKLADCRVFFLNIWTA